MRSVLFPKNDEDYDMTSMLYNSNYGENDEGKVPTIVVFPSLACNLQCPYCVKSDECSNASLYEKFLLSADFRQKTANIPPTHFLLSGGEPLLDLEVIRDFAVFAKNGGHKISFQTNLTLDEKILLEFFSKISCDILGCVNVTHHLLSGVDDEAILKNILALKKRGVPISVKYIGVPGTFSKIRKFREILLENKIRVTVGPLLGEFNGRIFPTGYTEAELNELIPMVANIVNGLLLFIGLESAGLSCSAGNTHITWNDYGRGEMRPCCEERVEIPWTKTFFHRRKKNSRLCRSPLCMSNIGLIDGVGRILDEHHRLATMDKLENPTQKELVQVARAIEKATGRNFIYWPEQLLRLSDELGLSPKPKDKEPSTPTAVSWKKTIKLDDTTDTVYKCSYGNNSEKAFGISFGIYGCGLTLCPNDNRDHLATEYFIIPETIDENRYFRAIFKLPEDSAGIFAWRVQIQDKACTAWADRTLRREPRSDRVLIEFVTYNFGDSLRITFTPLGERGKIYAFPISVDLELVDRVTSE